MLMAGTITVIDRLHSHPIVLQEGLPPLQGHPVELRHLQGHPAGHRHLHFLPIVSQADLVHQHDSLVDFSPLADHVLQLLIILREEDGQWEGEAEVMEEAEEEV